MISPAPSALLRYLALGLLLVPALAFAQIGRRFPSERKVVTDPVTGTALTFLTSTPQGDSKIYPTHAQWTADGQWLIFRSGRVPGQAMAVNEATGDLVQVTGGGYVGTLCIARQSMRLFLMRPAEGQPASDEKSAEKSAGGGPRFRGPMQIVVVDLARVFADSAAGKMADAAAYERVCGTVPADIGANPDMALDADETTAYFRLGRDAAAKALPAGTKIADTFGKRGMGAGPSGIGKMNLLTGEVAVVTAVGFQVGHIQASPTVPGEIMFCWETGGKAPQRTWLVNADGRGLRPAYPEAPYDWVTHEKFVTRDEIAFALMGHRAAGTSDEWGPSGTREHATGLAILNLRTKAFAIAGQTKTGSGLWHVDASPDGRWAVGDDFTRSLYLIDRTTNEMLFLTTGHKTTAADHPHPTFSADSTRIQIQSAMRSADGRAMAICIVRVPDAWLKRTYGIQGPPAGAPANP